MTRLTCLTLLLCAVIGCEDPVASVRVELYATGRDNTVQPLLTGANADVIEMVILRAEDPRGTQVPVDLSVSAGSGTLPVLPFADDYWFYVRGFRQSDVPPIAHFYGAASNVSVGEDEGQVVSIQIGQADCVGLNLGSAYNRDPAGSDDMKSGRFGATATELPDGRVLFTGGASVDQDGNIEAVLDTLEVYDPAKGQFIGLPFRLNTPRAHHTATLLNDGSVLIFGGVVAMENGTPRLTGSASIINIDALIPVQAVSRPLPDSEGRYRHQAVRLNDAVGSVLITGGTSAAGNHLATTWRFFPPGAASEGRFVQQGDLWTPRSWHSSNRIQHDPELALIAGGIAETGVVAASEVFTLRPGVGCVDPDQTPTPEIGCFQKLGGELGLEEARFGHQAIEVDGGRQVLFVGGYTTPDRANFAQSVELVDSGLNRTQAATLGTGRGELTASVLADQSVVLLGGRRGNTALTISERLRPQRDASGAISRYDLVELTAECDLSEPRYGHRAVTMRNGVVLVGGGLTAAGAINLVSRRGELYFPRVSDIEAVYPTPTFGN